MAREIRTLHAIERFVVKRKLELLREKWSKRTLKRSQGCRLIVHFIRQCEEENPIMLAILFNDITWFQSIFDEDTSSECFELCCLCGSEAIIEGFYLNHSKRVSRFTVSEQALAYALSSENEPLCVHLAELRVRMGTRDKSHLALYAQSIVQYRNIKKILVPSHKFTDPKTESIDALGKESNNNEGLGKESNNNDALKKESNNNDALKKEQNNDWKKWVGQVVANTNEEIQEAVSLFRDQDKVLPLTAKALQKIINERYTERIDQVLEEAEEQHRYCPY